jgi:hypothetical protein
MDGTQMLALVIVVETLIIIALLWVIFGQGKQLGEAYPADVKQVLGALAGLAVFFAAQSPTALDDTLMTTVLLPVFKLLGIDVTMPNATPSSTPQQPPTA